MTKGRSPAQKAASRRNLEKARAARAKHHKRKTDARAHHVRERQFALSGGTSKFVSMGVVNGQARLRRVISEKTSVIKTYKRKTERTQNADRLRREYEMFLKGAKVKR